MSEYRNPTIEELLQEGLWLRRLLKDALPADAVDDVLQETWSRALQGVPRARASLRPWLRQVAIRVAGALTKRESRRSDRERRSYQPTEQPPTAEIVARMDLQQEVAKAVKCLAEPYRTTVVLRYYEDLSVPEISKCMSVSTDSVYTRLARARTMIRDSLPESMRARIPMTLLPAYPWSSLALASALLLCLGGSAWVWFPRSAEPELIHASKSLDSLDKAQGLEATTAEQQLIDPSLGRRGASTRSLNWVLIDRPDLLPLHSRGQPRSWSRSTMQMETLQKTRS